MTRPDDGGFHVSRGSLPGWLSSAALVLGIVGYFFYERASDEKWMALEDKNFEAINDGIARLETQVNGLVIKVAEHRGEHVANTCGE